MNQLSNVDLPSGPAKWQESSRTGRPHSFWAGAISALLFTLAALAPTPARAVDGCLVLLCFAAPSWRSIPQCVPPIKQVLRLSLIHI